MDAASPDAVIPNGSTPESIPPITVDRTDPRYPDLVSRGLNLRFDPAPDVIHVASGPDDVVRGVQDAVDACQRLAVRSGGHCFEALVDHPEVTAVLDLSEMDHVGWDHKHQAFSVEAGTTLGRLYRTLFLRWGVTLPAGRCPDVGVGGHVMGGGGGALSRRFGLSVDHLYGVEVVTVDADGRAQRVLATREPGDPHRDLWWAHTGSGGGFGVLTRYLFRSDGPAALPTPPRSILKKTVRWQWSELDERAFAALVRNFTAWHEHHAEWGVPAAELDNSLTLPRLDGGAVTLETAVDAGRPDAEDLTDAFLRSIAEGAGPLPDLDRQTRPYLASVLVPDEFAGIKGRFKSKSAFLRQAWTDDQIAVAHRRLTDTAAYRNPAAALYLLSHGGAVNVPDGASTAMAHRDAAMKAYWSAFWWDPREDEHHLGWVRGFYADLFADAGGVPDPARGYSGAFINYADADLADPELNRSGIAWHALYHRGNYPRLQQAKARWDSLDIFRHSLSVRLPEGS